MTEKLKITLALGFFDGVHKGHAKVLAETVRQAELLSATPYCLFFEGNPKNKSGKAQLISDEKERERAVLFYGIKGLIRFPVNEENLNKSKDEFLREIGEKYFVACYVVGDDFRFGRNAEGNTEYLKKYASENGGKVCVVKEVTDDGKRVSSSLIKEYLKNGEIEKANSLLTFPFSLSGTVVHGRAEGHKLGFPTANFYPDSSVVTLYNGVYAGYAIIDGEKYVTIINYGPRPTFSLDDVLIEAHVIGYAGDLYGKEIRVYLTAKLRGQVKFDSEKQLRDQLEQDKKRAELIVNGAGIKREDSLNNNPPVK